MAPEPTKREILDTLNEFRRVVEQRFDRIDSMLFAQCQILAQHTRMLETLSLRLDVIDRRLSRVEEP